MGVQPSRFELPAGLAAVFGTVPLPLTKRLLRLPGAELSLDLDGDRAGLVAPPDQAAIAPVVAVLESLRGRIEPVVLSLAGPVTVALALMGVGVRRDEAMLLAQTAVLLRARALLDVAGELVPEAPVMLNMSEPGLVNSMHPSFPLAGDEIEGVVADVVSPLANDAMVGVTVDGRADWAMLIRTGISVLGAPVTTTFDSAAVELGNFLRDGGFVAWGAVPTNEPLGSSVERLWRRLAARWGELASMGIDPLLLRDRSIITATTGLAEFGLTQAERVVGMVQDLADRVLTQTVGSRLSIGA